MNILELYCGIGGMHIAFNSSQQQGTVHCAIDINQTAVNVYRHNFPQTNVINGNIQSLTVESLQKYGIDTILMSPPCQPFTRNGLQKDADDPRTQSFCHVLELLPKLNIERILMENVKGFENSLIHDQFVATLKSCGFYYKEFLLSPIEFGMPNSRTRYYCVARKTPFTKELTISHSEIYPILDVLEDAGNEYNVPMNALLKRYAILDVVFSTSTRSCCFTKSYGRYIEGTGSIYCPKSKDELDIVYGELKHNTPTEKVASLLQTLELRFFTAREICRLMAFPESFTFPSNVSRKQSYMLLGNSINCKVVSVLINLLK